MPDLFLQAFIERLAAVLSVPIAIRLGLDSVPGPLTAGMLIGPYAFGLVGSADKVLHNSSASTTERGWPKW